MTGLELTGPLVFPQPVRIDNPIPVVFENDPVTITCQTDNLGNPPARFTGPDFLTTSGSSNSATLTIPSASREDDGKIFTCTLEYEGQGQDGEAFIENYSATANLTVYYLPREVTVEGHNNNTTLEEGQDVILECFFQDYNPQPSITWWKDGVDLRGETSTTLKLESLKVGDKGAYVCKTTVNVLGQERSKESPAVYVNVTSTGGAYQPTAQPGGALPNTGDLPVSTIGTIAGVSGVLVLVIILIVSVICVRRKRNPGPNHGGEERVNGRNNVCYQPNGDVSTRPLLKASYPNGNNSAHGQEIVIHCREATIYPQQACDAESLETPSEPSMQLSTLNPTSLSCEPSTSSVEPRSDTTPKQPPSSDLFSTNEKLPYHNLDSNINNFSADTTSTDMSPTSEKLPYENQESSSGGYPKTGTSTEGGNPTSSSISSDLEEVTNPKLAAEDEDSSGPRSLHSNTGLPSLRDSLDVGAMISVDSDASRPTSSSPNLLSNNPPNNTGVPADSNNLNIPIDKPVTVTDKRSAINNLSGSSDTMEESIVLAGSGGGDQEHPPFMSEDVDSLREKGDEVAITIDLMLKKTPLKTDHLGLSESKLRDLYINLYSGDNNWKIFADKLGLNVQNIQVIDCCSTQHHLKAAEIVMYHWQRMADKEGSVPCSEEKLRELLKEIDRPDLIAILDGEQ
ncbi:uncharacterized protein [Branchiostoma lanceolatum]|uniref:uncharacterized protein n=1 Tax=Branchiostoma lanceolatum TaxID=7740 RepID=UPI0034565CF4